MITVWEVLIESLKDFFSFFAFWRAPQWRKPLVYAIILSLQNESDDPMGCSDAIINTVGVAKLCTCMASLKWFMVHLFFF